MSLKRLMSLAHHFAERRHERTDVGDLHHQNIVERRYVSIASELLQAAPGMERAKRSVDGDDDIPILHLHRGLHAS